MSAAVKVYIGSLWPSGACATAYSRDIRDGHRNVLRGIVALYKSRGHRISVRRFWVGKQRFASFYAEVS